MATSGNGSTFEQLNRTTRAVGDAGEAAAPHSPWLLLAVVAGVAVVEEMEVTRLLLRHEEERVADAVEAGDRCCCSTFNAPVGRTGTSTTSQRSLGEKSSQLLVMAAPAEHGELCVNHPHPTAAMGESRLAVAACSTRLAWGAPAFEACGGGGKGIAWRAWRGGSMASCASATQLGGGGARGGGLSAGRKPSTTRLQFLPLL